MKRSRVVLICILLLCLAGAWISGDLLRQHAGATDGFLAKVCRATTGTGCSAALESRWSEITIPVPPRLVVFTDFQCPACYCAAQSIENDIVAVFGGTIDVHLRHYPLCSDCNADVAGSIHPQACAAARAAESARLQGGEPAVRRMSALLFARRGELDDDVYRRLAGEIGLDPELLAAQMDSEEVHRLLRDDIAPARALGVTGTPAMFLDGRPVTELCNTFAFWRTYAKTHTGSAGIEIAGRVYQTSK